MEDIKPWLEIVNRVPFRSTYAYFDTENHCIDPELEKEDVKVRFHNEEFANDNLPFRVCFLNCWTRDKEKVERMLMRLANRLSCLDSDYWEYWRNIARPVQGHAADEDNLPFND